MKTKGSMIEELHQVPGAIPFHEKSALVITLDDMHMPIGTMSSFVISNYPNLYDLVKTPKASYMLDRGSIGVVKISGPFADKYAAVYGVILHRVTSLHASDNAVYIKKTLDVLHEKILYDKLSRVIMPRIGVECGLNWTGVVKPIIEKTFCDMNVSISY